MLKMTVSVKIWLSLGILLLGYFISMLLQFYNGQQTQTRLFNVAETSFPASRFSQNAKTDFNAQVQMYNDAVMLGDEALIEQADSKYKEVRQALVEMQSLSNMNEEEKNQIDQLIKDLETFSTQAGGVYKGMATQTETDAGKIGELAAQTEKIKKILADQTQRFIDETRNELLDIKQKTRQQFTISLILFFVIALWACISAWFIISRFISRPIKQTVMMLKDIAQGEGDLTKRLDIKSKDEIGEMGNWFNVFINNIQEIIREMSQNAVSLDSASVNLKSLSDQMNTNVQSMSGKSKDVAEAVQTTSSFMASVAATSEESATNVQAVSAAVEEMSATVNEIAQNSENARNITDKAVTITKQASHKVDELGKAAVEINKVTEVITEISEQTNLLALNATIEAARAGESGRGFAVVATEIKELAKQTANATNEIRSKINGIQTSTNETVNQIEQISKVIDDVNTIVSSIAAAVEEQAVTTREIANNVNQASTGIQDVNQNVVKSSEIAKEMSTDVMEFDQAVTQIGGNSSRVNTNSEDLAKLAGQLKDMVKRFKL